jgi:deoxyadenosine/deoxycytidine kinase
MTTSFGKPVVIVVDGLIGSGKTSLIDMLLEHLSKRGLRVTIVKEPVEKWKESGILQLFYKDPARWGYTFQTKAFHDRVIENRNAHSLYGNSTDVFILERSPFTDPLFVNLLKGDGFMNDVEYKTYHDWWAMWSKVMPYEPDIFVYLRPTLEECMRRVQERSRPGEEGIDIEYQRKLLEQHDTFFASSSIEIGNGHHVPCVRIETNANFRDDLDVKNKITSFFEIISRSLRMESHPSDLNSRMLTEASAELKNSLGS